MQFCRRTKKGFKHMMLFVLSATSLNAPAWAEADSDAKLVTNTATTAKKSSYGPLSVTKSLLSVCVGTIVGTPVCFMKKLPQEIKEEADGAAGSVSESKLLLVPSALVMAPFASIWAAIESPGYAFRDAWMSDKPFSKESFSLTELDKGKGGAK